MLLINNTHRMKVLISLMLHSLRSLIVIFIDLTLLDYCSHEAGVRNLRKCLDRIFRKVVAKLENKKIEDGEETTATVSTSIP